jgi:putative transposase
LLRRQCEILGLSRSGLYYEPIGTSAEGLSLMRRIDEIHLQWPFYGSRKGNRRGLPDPGPRSRPD